MLARSITCTDCKKPCARLHSHVFARERVGVHALAHARASARSLSLSLATCDWPLFLCRFIALSRALSHFLSLSTLSLSSLPTSLSRYFCRCILAFLSLARALFLCLSFLLSTFLSRLHFHLSLTAFVVVSWPFSFSLSRCLPLSSSNAFPDSGECALTDR